MHLSLTSLVARQCNDSLQSFVSRAFPIIEPGTRLSWNWHLDLICDTLAGAQPGNRFIFNVPPGSMKSTLINVMWPTWLWARRENERAREREIERWGRLIHGPTLRFLTFSYSDKNTIRDNLRARQIIDSPWFKQHFPETRLKSDQNAKERFDTTQLGWRIASSVGGAGTGDHPDVMVIDDPLKALDSLYETSLGACINWWKSTVSTRLNRNPVVALVMQRLAIGDLTDWLLEQKENRYEHVCLPMHYESRRRGPDDKRAIPHPRDPRNEDGELLWPDKFPETKVRDMEIELGPFFREGQLEQYPVPVGGRLMGGLLKAEYVDIEQVPRSVVRCRGWDIAETKVEINPSANLTVGMLLGYDAREDILYIIDRVQTQDEGGEVDKLILSTAERDGRNTLVREGAGSGKANIRHHRAMLSGFNYDSVSETDSKIQRAEPFRRYVDRGKVRIVRGEWNAVWISYMIAFPGGRYDDDTDATSNAANTLIGDRVYTPGGTGS